MAAKLDTDVSRGRAGVSMGELSDQTKQPEPPQLGSDQSATDLNGLNGKGFRGGWKYKKKGAGKGTDKGGDMGKSKGKGAQTKLNAIGDGKGENRQLVHLPSFTGCFVCGGKHYARDCLKSSGGPAGKSTHAGVLTLCGLKVTESMPRDLVTLVFWIRGAQTLESQRRTATAHLKPRKQKT